MAGSGYPEYDTKISVKVTRQMSDAISEAAVRHNVTKNEWCYDALDHALLRERGIYDNEDIVVDLLNQVIAVLYSLVDRHDLSDERYERQMRAFVNFMQGGNYLIED